MSDPHALQQVQSLAPGGEADVPGDGQMREQPIVLRDVADAALLGHEVSAPVGVKPQFRAEGDVPMGGALEPRDGPEQ
jgi:hypothetical protein